MTDIEVAFVESAKLQYLARLCAGITVRWHHWKRHHYIRSQRTAKYESARHWGINESNTITKQDLTVKELIKESPVHQTMLHKSIQTMPNTIRMLPRIPFRHLAIIMVMLCQNVNVLPPLAAESDESNQQPNILLIMADDLGWKDLNCQDNPKLKTPNLDKLASKGVRFTDAYAAAPVCSPTRAALITGLAPARLHITQHGPDGKSFWPDDRKVQPPPSSNELSTEYFTLAEKLKAAGYSTGFFGKWHLGNAKEFWPSHHGFDVNLGGCGFGGPPTYFDPYRIPTLPSRQPGEYLSDRLAEETITYMRQNHKNPMFICLWTYNPHYPFEAPEELIDGFVGKEGRGLKNPIYGAQLEATDRAIGRVLNELEQLRVSDKTLVIFTSDNGGWSGATDNHPLRQGKGYLYEGGLRVPLIIRWPGHTKEGTTNSTPVISMDLTSTILEATQDAPSPPTLEKGKTLDGVSLIPLLDGKSIERNELYFHYPHFAFHRSNRPGSAIRNGNYKLILNYDDSSTELYDLKKDISETNDLSKEKPELSRALLGSLNQWLDEVGADRPTPREN